MKKTALRFICAVLSLFIVFGTVFSFNGLALIKKGPDIDVIVSDANEDNVVTVDIAFTKNPGIGALTFTLLYDNTCFSTVQKGKTTYTYLPRYFYSVIDTNVKKYLIVDHPTDGYVSIVWSPEGSADLYTGTGVVFRFTFKIDRQINGKHPFEIGNINPKLRGKDLSGCFSDFEHNTFQPNANNDSFIIGGVNTIPDSYPWLDKPEKKEEGDDPVSPEHTHNYKLHKKIDPSCDAGGYSIFECECGNKETRDKTAALGHSFTDYWTVDRVATDSVAMKISKHCIRCNASKDVYYYTEEKAKKLGIKNVVGTKVYENEDNGIVSKTNNSDDANSDEVIENTVDSEKIKSAEELIDAVEEKEEGKTPTGKVKKTFNFFQKLYYYLIGTKSKPGILRIIIRSIIKFFK